MENVLKYFEFSDFFEDTSGTFSGNSISYSVLNEEHFLVFQKTQENKEIYTLFVAKYTAEKDIGKQQPLILELLVEQYDESNPEHRILLRKYKAY
ncbi:hypothetical protein [Tenacibaculum sp. SG-28]|uniref:hypothetical protein n=1 Tax=Tenacibaculum sp. SG-28 TaxID=754426 RepID=UPI000CF38142|nr:hypothetical protein [Tenacibaculum sp. SG-28]PQJ20646.1 hypothetical protein BSU00_10090 [Tenacibaculum sp. SG-28]